jgi:hypothetical protein
MTKNSKLIGGVLLAFAIISLLHLWLNIGFDKLGFGSSERAENSLRVGFLPVT